MRITDTDINHESLLTAAGKPSLQVSYESSASTTQAARPPASGLLARDSATISQTASQTASLVSKTMSLPELNSGRVSDVQRAIASGQFHINSATVATALIRTMLEGA